MARAVADRLTEEADAIALVDTHEHIIDERERTRGSVDLFYLFKDYASSDLLSAGLSPGGLDRILNPDLDLDLRWQEFAPHWEHVRTTGYGRAVRLAARDLYDIDDITAATYHELSERVADANRPGLYERVLHERANIEVAANQAIPEFDPTPIEAMDRRYFVPVVCLDRFATACSHSDIAALEHETAVKIHCLDDLLAAVDTEFQRSMAAGAVALKIAIAYRRTLHVEKPTRAEAEGILNGLMSQPTGWQADFREAAAVSWAHAKPLQDYILHYLVRRCAAADVPIVVHTGIQDGSGNVVSNSDPLLLTDLLVEYREARFDIFHGGYPYASSAAVLGKCFPNVFLDLCWVHVISPWVACQTLHEWIETVPSNKIMAFGGDYTFVEGAYAHARIARANVVRVLTEKVDAGYLDEDEADALLVDLLRNNALRFLGISPSSQ